MPNEHEPTPTFPQGVPMCIVAITGVRAPGPRARSLPATLALSVLAGALPGCAPGERAEPRTAEGAAARAAATVGLSPTLPAPNASESATNFARVVGWPEGRTPTAPPGFSVSLYAGGLDHPRWLYVLPNGDVLVAESNTGITKGRLPPRVLAWLGSNKLVGRVTHRYVDGVGMRDSKMYGPSANRITLLRDADGNGVPELRTTFVAGLKQPMGMALVGSDFYVANTDGLVRYPYRTGQSSIDGAGTEVLDLPAGGHNMHWARNVVAGDGGNRLYVSVGSATDADTEGIDAKDVRRAAILEVARDGSGMRVFASGLRNPVGMAWAPGTNELWAVGNERDRLGDDLVPDFLTSVREGGFYGWPYAYHGQHEDPRHRGKRPDLVAKAIAPSFALGAHVAPVGLAFYTDSAFPSAYRGGAFVAEHGSWNRSRLAGYKVVYIPFRDGQPAGPAEDFLTGFIASETPPRVYGRPAGVAVLGDGSLLVADDAGNSIWRVAPRAAPR